MRSGPPAMLVLALLVAGCSSAPAVRTPGLPRPVVAEARTIEIHPTPTWPARVGPPSPVLPPQDQGIVSAAGLPSAPISASGFSLLAPATVSLPLPTVRLVPLKQTPTSRSWQPVTQAKSVPVPVPPAAVAGTKAASPAGKSSAAKNEAKSPATIPAQSQAVPVPAAPSPATPAASASLLPGAEPASADFRWEDLNAVAGDSVTLHFDKTNWLYLDSAAQQKILGFQSINRDKTATTFQFKPTLPGQYVLEFQRQDLVNQSTDLRKVRLTVVAAGTRTSATSTAQNPQTSMVSANDLLESSRQLAAAGKIPEAVQRLVQSGRIDDARVNLELARLMEKSGQGEEALSVLDRNQTLLGPEFLPSLELGTRLAAARAPHLKLPAYVKLWSEGSAAPPEELYIQVLDALRSEKWAAMAAAWVQKYALWYPAPVFRDRYLFQVGQLLEEPGPGRDVRGAWRAYNEVVQNYPLSSHWKAAGERAAYLNRQFLQVR